MSIRKTQKDIKDLIETINNLYAALGKKIPDYLKKPVEDIISYYKTADEAYNSLFFHQKV